MPLSPSILRVTTANSVYLIDYATRMMKRDTLDGPDLKGDGVWTGYEDLLICEVGLPMEITWFDGERSKVRITSPVITIDNF